MAKNIIIFADGTGNQGGYTPDSNVYRMYNAIDIHLESQDQVTFYDNGVGTAKNKYLRALGGAFGFGFGLNVCDLYYFLAKNYEPGDKIYLMGFSRGAATVRAFTGFVAACGLIKYDKGSDDRDLRQRIKSQFKEYKRIGRRDNQKGLLAESSPDNHGAVPIEFVGVWDTVSALGFPQNTAITGIGMWVLNALLVAADHVSDWVFPHRFYNYDLTENIQHGYHCLAIGDARTSFRPMVWDETGRKDGTVEQVWFAGMHSNVGGGYERAGMANVALIWMMVRAEKHGLILKEGPRLRAREDANVFGRLYDSRDGAAIYYRYSPREIDALCEGKIQGPIKIHESVTRRMKYRTANYAPDNLPGKFRAVATDDIGGKDGTDYEPTTQPGWDSVRNRIKKWTNVRKWLYGIFLEATLFIVGAAIYLWALASGGDCILKKPLEADPSTIPWAIQSPLNNLADILNYILPDMACGLIQKAVIDDPEYLGGAVVFFAGLWVVRKMAQQKMLDASEDAREIVLKSSPEATDRG